MRQKLQQLCDKISAEINDCAGNQFESRVFTDSAPVLEVALAEKAGLGWRGKHTLLLNKDHGSWFFLWLMLPQRPIYMLAQQFTGIVFTSFQGGNYFWPAGCVA